MRRIILFMLPAAVVLGALSCSYSAKATRQLLQKAKSSGPFDVIIVPGVPFENGKWNRTMKGRIYWSKYLFDKGIAKNIMYSGSAVYTAYYEAEIMAMYAKAIGIPAKNIYTETKAEHSTENAYYGYKKAQQLGFEHIALASDPFQTKLLRRYVRKKVNSEMSFIPMVIDTMKVIEPAMIDPDIKYQEAFKPNFISIKERESFWKRLKGTLRGNIDTTAYGAK
ncbi:YdcF family protein [Agriterribacter humi]|uniref:YdcF family protein n=1 Tax=Agriterribacter humi TaxID=1104781 RepID=UPI001264FF91|nr:YdcF family protein [Agriterribacter humi]